MYTQKNMKTVTVMGLLLGFAAIITAFIACEAPDPTGPAASSRVTLTSTRTDLPADGSSTAVITAYVLDRKGFPADGPIYWSTTSGALDTATGTLSGGYANVTFTAPNYAGNPVITADAVHAQNSIELNVHGFGIDLGANPQSIPADGSSKASVTAYVYSHSGHPVDDGTSVSFTTTAGTLGAASVTTSGGWAVTSLTSSASATTAMVRAQVEASFATTYVNFANPVGTMTLTAFPTTREANGAEKVRLTVVVKREDGTPSPGVVIGFEKVGSGTFEFSQVTTGADGAAVTWLIAPYSTTTLYTSVTAFTGEKKSNTVTITFTGYTGTPNPSPTPQPTFTRTPTPTQTPTGAATNTPTQTPTMTPTPVVSTATPTWTPVPTNTP